MVCVKLAGGNCRILASTCQKPYRLKMGIANCPILRKAPAKTKAKKATKKASKKTRRK